MNIMVKVYNDNKFETIKEADFVTVYTNVEWWELKEIVRQEIERITDGTCVDENNMYVVLHFENGDTAIFRDTHVDIFRV